MLPGVFSGCGRAGTTSQQTHTHTHPPTPHTHTHPMPTQTRRKQDSNATWVRLTPSPHTSPFSAVFGRFRGKTIQRPRGAIAWRQRAFDPPESHLEMWHFEGEGRVGGHLTNLGLSRGNAQVSGPGIASEWRSFDEAA